MELEPKPQNFFNIFEQYTYPQIKETIEEFLGIWLKQHFPNNIPELYHYTTLKGLQGIIKERALWFSHAHTMNDPDEIQYGMNIIKDVVNDFSSGIEDKNAKYLLKSLSDHLYSINHLDIFIVSFCESGNLLSQWRAYSNKGDGFNLGFSFSDELKLATSVEHIEKCIPPNFRKIIYDQAAQKSLVKTYLEILLKKIQPELYDDNRLPEKVSIIALQSVNVLLDMLLTFKSDAFKEEKEWRLLRIRGAYTEHQDLKFRENNEELIPYLETYMYQKIDKDENCFPLNSITIGPGLDPMRWNSTLRLFIGNMRNENHPIKLRPGEITIKNSNYKLR